MLAPYLAEGLNAPFSHAGLMHRTKGNAFELAEMGRAVGAAWINITRAAIQSPFNPAPRAMLGSLSGMLDFAHHMYGAHMKHEFDFSVLDAERTMELAQAAGVSRDQVHPRTINGAPTDFEIEIVDRKPFGNLKHFVVTDAHGEPHAPERPPLLIVAPMSGHFDTLLTGTVYRLMRDYDLYITDWQDAKNIPVSAGTFDLDSYISYLKDDWLPLINERHQDGDTLQRKVHTLAVCQPGVPLMAATAMMDEDNSPHTPLSVTMMGSPIDTRLSPTKVNKLAEERGINWFLEQAISQVAWGNAGAGRKVYPGKAQLLGFMMMNADSHIDAHKEMALGMAFQEWNEKVEKGNFRHLTLGSIDTARRREDFYKEYKTVCDLPAEFYLQTIDTVFQRHLLPRGEMIYTDPHTSAQRIVNPSSISRVAIMTVEGGRDDITGRGQTSAIHDLTPNLPDDMRTHHEQTDVGHYGLFNGKQWRTQIAPRMIHFTSEADRKNGLVYAPRSETLEAYRSAGIEPEMAP